MANQEHLVILKQGVEVWNRWRSEYTSIRPDLSFINLRDTLLRGINLANANIIGTTLRAADLTDANFSGADIKDGNLSFANLIRADLTCADLSGANLSLADLNEAVLWEADLSLANFNGATLLKTDFSQTTVALTIFGDTDLSQAKGLDTMNHLTGSIIDIDTIYRSKDNISEIFLKSVGVPNTLITYVNSLIKHPIEYYTCFISYSSRDQAFAERLHADLQSKNVRCWYAPEDLKIGDKFRMCIDESIRLYDKLLLILSEHSVRSPWVEKEVETAFSKEHKSGKLTLFPIKLDNTVMETDQAWAADIRRMRHIGDFTRWKEHDEYQKGLNRLLRDLKQDTVTL